jgi:RNA polymerase sigma factor (sigma-70 family)
MSRKEKLAVLFEKYHIQLYNFFIRLTGNRGASEDLVQEVFLRILKYRKTFRGESKFTIWMYQIARNTHIDFLRKRKGELPLEDQWEEAAEPEPSASAQMEQSQDADLVRQALALLPRKKREVLVLSRFQGLKYREIADLLGCRIGTVKAHVHRAVKELGRIYCELSGGEVL